MRSTSDRPARPDSALLRRTRALCVAVAIVAIALVVSVHPASDPASTTTAIPAAGWLAIYLVMAVACTLMSRALHRARRAAEQSARAARQSEERLRLAQAGGKVGVWDWTSDGDESYWSESMWTLYGREAPPDGKPTRDLWLASIHPDDRAHVLAHIDRVLASTDTDYRDEYRIVRPDGSERWLQSAAQIARDPAGGPTRMYGSNVDITEHKRTEEALRTSEERFRAFLDNSPARAWLKDEQGRYVLVSRSLLRGFGLHEHDILGRTDAERFLPALAEEFRRNDLAVLRSRAPLEVRERSVEPDGEHHFLSIKFPFRDAEGRWFVGGVGVDITQQTRAEEQLQRVGAENLRQREFYERLIEACPVVIAVVQGPELRFTMLNAACRAIAGTQGRPEIGRTYQEVFPEAAELGAAEHLRDVIRTGETWQIRDFRTPIGSRQETWWEGEVLPLENDAALHDAALIIAWDITERKQAEQALRDADRRKDEFLATLAHELRNPLAPIRNSLHVLRLAGADAKARERVVDMMERQVHHLVRLVDDLLEISRITRGKIELRKETVELAAVVRGAVETVDAVVQSASHRLTVDIPPGPVLLTADPVRLSQVLANLLHNAAKYTEKGGQIWLTARVEGDTAVLSVRDTGMGIPAEMLPRVFDLFAQVDHTLGRAQGGLGIGLALVKRLVELHGGSVEARSDGPGRGSEFVVRLPLPRTADDTLAPPAPRIEPLPPRRVLVVDDNCDAADTLATLLEFVGAEVEVVYDGPAALAAMRRRLPDIVLLDLGMPGMDGHAVARHVREDPALRSVTLIALTGWGQAEDYRRSRAAGFDRHLVKPVDLNTLRTLLAALPQGASAREA